MKNKMDIAKKKHDVEFLMADEYSQDMQFNATKEYDFFSLSDPNKQPVLIKGYTDFLGGYAAHTRNILFGLDSLNKFDIKLEKIRSGVDLDPFAFGRVKKFTYSPININDSTFIMIGGPGWGLKEKKRKARKKIIWTMTESRHFPSYMKKWFDGFDEIWLPTTLDLHRLDNMKELKKKTVLMKLGINLEHFNPSKQPMKIRGLEDKFVFGFIGSWNVRKGIKEIIRAFTKAFLGNKDVALVLFAKYATRPYGVFQNVKNRWNIIDEFNDYLKGCPRESIPKILICDVSLHPSLMPHLISRMDVGIGASLGESTWLPGLEFGAMKKTVIQSEWGGHRDYLDPDNSYLVKTKGFEKANKSLYRGTSEYYKGQEFAVIDEESLMDRMIQAYEDETVRKEKAENLFQTVQDWTWEKSVQDVSNLISY